MLLFKREFHPGIASGAVTVTFRHWKSPRVTVGKRYPCRPIGLIEVTAIDRVRFGEVAESDVAAAGFGTREELAAFLRGARALPEGDETELYRVAFRFAGPEPEATLPAEDKLSEDDVSAIAARLEAMDRRSSHGPWTGATLALIGEEPGVAASRLAPRLGRERLPFKADVRKLKKLGLTISLETGYRISPRGRAFLDAAGRATDGDGMEQLG